MNASNASNANDNNTHMTSFVFDDLLKQAMPWHNEFSRKEESEVNTRREIILTQIPILLLKKSKKLFNSNTLEQSRTMRMTSHTTTEQICSHQSDNNNNNSEEGEICSMCFHLKNMEENDSLLRYRRLNKNTTNGDKLLERSLTINIPCGIIADKQPKIKRASSSVIRRSPNNKLLYRTLTPSCCPDSRKPITCRPPTPYFSEETQSSRRRSKQFSFEDEEEDDEVNREVEDTKL